MLLSKTERKNKFLSLNKKTKLSMYQVLLLDNDKSQDVSVQEAEAVDFGKVKAHLKTGGSVFITSRASQKITLSKTCMQANYNRSRKTLGLLFHKHMRSRQNV